MKSLSCYGTKATLDATLNEVKNFDPHMLLIFAAPSLFQDSEALAQIREVTALYASIGCSTSGEIAQDRLHDDSFVCLAARFDRTQVSTVSLPVLRAVDSRMAGESLAAQLAAPGLRSVILLAPGTNLNGSALVHELGQRLGRSVTISGGMAGDGARFQQTFTLHKGAVSSDCVVALGLYGDAIEVSTGSDGGWLPFGPARRVTRSEGNILYEIDGRPALQLYKEYLGEQAKFLPKSGLSFPFAILREDRQTTGLIRAALDIDHEKGALIMAGDVPEGCLVCLMHADNEALTEGARQAASMARTTNNSSDPDGLALLVSCVARRLVMMLDTDDELDAVREALGSEIAIGGFYSYGEICPFAGVGDAEMHNQTMTITYLTERKGT